MSMEQIIELFDWYSPIQHDYVLYTRTTFKTLKQLKTTTNNNKEYN